MCNWIARIADGDIADAKTISAGLRRRVPDFHKFERKQIIEAYETVQKIYRKVKESAVDGMEKEFARDKIERIQHAADEEGHWTSEMMEQLMMTAQWWDPTSSHCGKVVVMTPDMADQLSGAWDEFKSTEMGSQSEGYKERKRRAEKELEDCVQKWIRNVNRKIEEQEVDWIMLPWCQALHWRLIAINLKRARNGCAASYSKGLGVPLQAIQVFEPLSLYNDKALHRAIGGVQRWLSDFIDNDVTYDWTLCRAITQTDEKSCGACCIVAIRWLLCSPFAQKIGGVDKAGMVMMRPTHLQKCLEFLNGLAKDWADSLRVYGEPAHSDDENDEDEKAEITGVKECREKSERQKKFARDERARKRNLRKNSQQS